MNNDNVTIRSTAKAIIGLNVPSLNLRRTWYQKNSIQKIPMDLLEQAIFEPGVEYLFKSGILYIEDLDVKKKLGLENEEVTEPTKILLLDDKTIRNILFNYSLNDFKTIIEKLSHNQLIELANEAVRLKIMDYQKTKILKEKTDIDVLHIVIRKNQEEESKTQKDN